MQVRQTCRLEFFKSKTIREVPIADQAFRSLSYGESSFVELARSATFTRHFCVPIVVSIAGEPTLLKSGEKMLNVVFCDERGVSVNVKARREHASVRWTENTYVKLLFARWHSDDKALHLDTFSRVVIGDEVDQAQMPKRCALIEIEQSEEDEESSNDDGRSRRKRRTN